MLQRFYEHWPEICLALFAVAAGQIGRVGQKLERGEPIGLRQVIIELSMFPAFGSLAGALGVELGWPIWLILAAGITAGWLGFFTFRLITKLTIGFLKGIGKALMNSDQIASWFGQDAGSPGSPPTPPPPPAPE